MSGDAESTIDDRTARDRAAIRAGLDDDGFVVLPDFLTVENLAAAIAEVPLMYPEAEQFHGDPDGEQARRFRSSQFGGVELLPFASPAWNLLALDPRLIEVARAALGTDDIRLYQAEAWAKFSGAIDYDQPLHRDFGNHTIVVPTDDPRFGHVEMFLYLNGVDADLGPTCAVSHRYTADIPVGTRFFPDPDEHGELYDVEQPVLGGPGTLLVYLPSTFHRGSTMRRDGAARYTLHLNFRTAAAEWVGRRGWGNHASDRHWRPLVEQLSPDQLSVFGFPPPGHPYWSGETLDGVQRRYPGLDMAAWRAAAMRR
jgi:ectoine hydroxylase-related dioxygenase (phytanoyl-CoA dioxygenase family)